MNLLQNKTVCLRAPEPEDLELLYSWENNPEWWEIGNTLAPYSRYLLKEYIAESHRGIFDLKQLRLMIDLCSTGATVGMLDLYDFDPHHRRAGVGILVDPLYQKNGLATEALELLAEYAFSYLKLHQLFVHIPIGNEPSKALFARCGFTVTGILTDWITTKDGYSDVLTMEKINERNLRFIIYYRHVNHKSLVQRGFFRVFGPRFILASERFERFFPEAFTFGK